MNLWIRTQDKKALIPINKMITYSCEGLFYDGIILGTYKTEERALEVLDEIKNILMPKIIINFKHKPIYKNDLENNLVFVHDSLVPYEDYEDKQLLTYVYEMPKE